MIRVYLSIALLFFLGNDVKAQNIPNQIFSLDSYVENGDWNTKDGKYIAIQLINSGKKELARLEAELATGTDDVEVFSRFEALQSALQPYLLSPTDSTPENDLIKRQELVARAKLAYGFVGQEKVLADLSKKMISRAKNKIQRSRGDAFSPSTILSERQICELLRLTEIQKDSVKSLITEFRSKLQVGSEDEFRQLEILYDDNYVNIAGELDDTQNEKFEAVAGKPVHWFRNANDKVVARLRSGIYLFQHVPAKLQGFKSADGRRVADLEPWEVRENGFEYLHGHVELMLKSPFVWDELELTLDQRNELRETKDYDAVSSGKFREKRLSELFSGRRNYPKALKEILVEEQMELLGNIEFQVLTMEFFSSIGALHPEVDAHLELTKSQRESIQRISSRFMTAQKEILGKIELERVDLQARFENEILALLDDEQELLYQKLMGQWESAR